MERVRDHPDFNHFFVEYPGDTTWMEANLFDGDTTGDNRIPYEILSLPAAEVVFKNIVNQLHAHNHQLEWVECIIKTNTFAVLTIYLSDVKKKL